MPRIGKSAHLFAIAIVLVLASTSTLSAGTKAQLSQRALGFLISAVISGAVSGAVAAEIAEQYTISRNAIRDGLLEKPESVKGVTQDGVSVSVPKGTYEIIAEAANKSGNNYLVIEVPNIDRLVVIFVEA